MPAPINAWSYSRLKKFEACRYQAFLAYVEKIPDPSGPAALRGSAIHKDAELFIKSELDTIPPTLTKIEKDLLRFRDLHKRGLGTCEENWAFTINWEPTGWFADNAWARVKVDFEARELPHQAEIVDFKTGKKWGNEVAHAQQGQQYEIATFLKYPDVQICKTRFLYTDQPAPNNITERITNRETALRILPALHSRALALTECTEFPPNPNKFNCKWCPYKPSKSGHCKVGVD